MFYLGDRKRFDLTFHFRFWVVKLHCSSYLFFRFDFARVFTVKFLSIHQQPYSFEFVIFSLLLMTPYYSSFTLNSIYASFPFFSFHELLIPSLWIIVLLFQWHFINDLCTRICCDLKKLFQEFQDIFLLTYQEIYLFVVNVDFF